jgi:hypothetical protein
MASKPAETPDSMRINCGWSDVGGEDEPMLNDMSLWCVVYDGPLYWGTNADGTGRSAFQYIRYLELQVPRGTPVKQ